MSLKVYKWLLMIGMLASLGVWLAVLFSVDPYESGVLGQIYFFASFFVFLIAIFVNGFVHLRKKFLGEDVAVKTIGLSFRQGFLLSFLMVSLVGLNMGGFLVWWVGLLVIAGIFLIELFFLSREE